MSTFCGLPAATHQRRLCNAASKKQKKRVAPGSAKEDGEEWTEELDFDLDEDFESSPRNKKKSTQVAWAWLGQAERDLQCARKLLREFPSIDKEEDGQPEPAACVWLCHQVVEKALKAVLLRTSALAKDEPQSHDSHDLVMLARHGMLAKRDQFDASLTDLKWLKEAYNLARYPTGKVLPADLFDVDDAERALDLATMAVEWAEQRF